jgi:hypothetical protein
LLTRTYIIIVLTVGKVTKEIGVLHATTYNVHMDISVLRLQEEIDRIITWLSAPNPLTNHNRALEQHYEGTGLWFIRGNVFEGWKRRKNSFL